MAYDEKIDFVVPIRVSFVEDDAPDGATGVGIGAVECDNPQCHDRCRELLIYTHAGGSTIAWRFTLDQAEELISQMMVVVKRQRVEIEQAGGPRHAH